MPGPAHRLEQIVFMRYFQTVFSNGVFKRYSQQDIKSDKGVKAGMSRLAIHGGKITNAEGHVKWPLITERDKEFVMKAVEEGILWGVFAPQVKGLEKEWGEYVGTKHCLSCNSGTAGLHMAVAAAGIGPGDEVITPSLTFVASAMCALQANAIPVFVDVDPRTFCMDPKLIEAKITEKTKAIIPVDLHGITADMDEINAIAKKHHLVVIADACQSHGATYKGRKAGTLADMSVFSLNGLKNLPGADGGLFNTDSDEYNEKANQLRIFGERVSKGHGQGLQFERDRLDVPIPGAAGGFHAVEADRP